jgi:hypothetical protein
VTFVVLKKENGLQGKFGGLRFLKQEIESKIDVSPTRLRKKLQQARDKKTTALLLALVWVFLKNVKIHFINSEPITIR